MGKLKNNQSGFSAVEIVLVLAVVVLIGVVGWLVYRNHHKINTTAITTTTSAEPTTTTKSPTTTPVQPANPYAGWKTFSLSSLGLSFQYPSSWTVTQGEPQCTGAIQVSMTPPDSEISQAATTLNTNLKKYSAGIVLFGTQSSKCAPDGNNFKGDEYTYLQSSDQITSGVFKEDWLTFFGSTTGDKSQTLPDTGIVTDTQYSSSPNTFVDAGTVAYNNKTYQINIGTDTGQYAQSAVPVPLNMDLFKTTSLYKDTLSILNSINKD
ncbi:MAG TPA: hypothetical protein VNE40_02210 [Candidatus Dormibacteraeota bacterium]|nr:hypothetical protein [Candidatus Dormibacteraeota bacterium]